MYKPNPLNLNNIDLPESLLNLVEEIAENVHDNWARKRLNEGWKYGSERNESFKITPCLVPYNDLTENEKEYDRITAMETIKLIIKLGYKIERNG